MSKYILRRVLLSIPALLGVTIVIFVALRVMPGDTVSVMFGTQATHIRPEDRAKIEADLGLSLPLIVQRGPLTVEIAVMAIVLSWVVGIPVGVLSAMRQNTLLDYVARFFTVLF